MSFQHSPAHTASRKCCWQAGEQRQDRNTTKFLIICTIISRGVGWGNRRSKFLSQVGRLELTLFTIQIISFLTSFFNCDPTLLKPLPRWSPQVELSRWHLCLIAVYFICIWIACDNLKMQVPTVRTSRNGIWVVSIFYWNQDSTKSISHSASAPSLSSKEATWFPFFQVFSFFCLSKNLLWYLSIIIFPSFYIRIPTKNSLSD